MAKQPTIIVLGNEKGGTGKSTVSMHLIVYLMQMGFKVGSIDLDARQGTLSRYIENRVNTVKNQNILIPLPDHHALVKSDHPQREQAEQEDIKNFSALLEQLAGNKIIVIDTPGSDQYLSRLAHSYADILITPLNDSFVDLDMMARIDSQTGQVVRPSTYCEMVWEQKKQRALRGQTSFDWIVLRNRLSNIFAKNKEEMREAVQKLSKRVGFRGVTGFSERVIFRELFLKGLTVLDLQDAGIDLSLSHVAARQELRELLQAINIPIVQEKLAQSR